MARSEKNSFIVYYDLEKQTLLLSDEQMGKLFRAMFAYEVRGECPNFDNDQMLLMTFQFVKTTLDINREKYIETCHTNSENGKKGGRPSNKNNSSRNDATITYSDRIQIPKAGAGFNGYQG